MSVGFVYLIRAGASGPVKIGWASDPHKRLAQLQSGNHEQLRLLDCDQFPVEDAREIERDLHQTFAAQRIRGEWFRAEGPVLQLIEAVVDHGVSVAAFRERTV